MGISKVSSVKINRTKKNRAIFLDRDGVINEVVIENSKPASPRKLEEFRLILDIEKPLQHFRESGFLNIVITNQPDVARGLLSLEVLEKMNRHIKESLPIDDILFCPHDDNDMCLCRKPNPGLIISAAKTWGIDLSKSYFIGDTWRDMEAGKKVGCKTVLLNKSYNNDTHSGYDFKINSLNEVVCLLK